VAVHQQSFLCPRQLPSGDPTAQPCEGDCGRSDLPPRPSATKRLRSEGTDDLPSPTARGRVLFHSGFLSHILRFLGGPGRGTRGDLGRAALVCRAWRVASCADGVWAGIVGELFPCMNGRVPAGGGRAYLVEHGRAMCEHRGRVEGERAWWGGLRVHFEVWDGGDGLRLLSAEGPVGFDEGDDSLFLIGDGTRLIAPSFTAASRDGPSGSVRFTSVPDYFRRAHEGGGGVHVRVTVRDACSGRQGVLWSSDKSEVLRVEERGGGSYCIYPLGEFRALLLPPPPRSLKCRSPTTADGPIGGHFWFGLQAKEGQGGFAERERVFEAGGVCRFYFDTGDPRRIARFLSALLS
jgi:hypothetical protein